MQAIYKNEDEKSSSKRTNLVGVILYTEGVSKYLEREYLRRLRSRSIRIYNSKRIFSRFEERV